MTNRAPSTILKKIDTGHWQVSCLGYGFADIVQTGAYWQVTMYKPGGTVRCKGGYHNTRSEARKWVDDRFTSLMMG